MLKPAPGRRPRRVHVLAPRPGDVTELAVDRLPAGFHRRHARADRCDDLFKIRNVLAGTEGEDKRRNSALAGECRINGRPGGLFS